MKEITWYEEDSDGDAVPDPNGRFALRHDVEALQKELEDMRAKAFAAAWLMRDDVTIQELQLLREEAGEVLMGKDKEALAKLREYTSCLEDELKEAQRSRPKTGITSVYGRKGDVDYALCIFEVVHDPNGYARIGVYLP